MQSYFALDKKQLSVLEGESGTLCGHKNARLLFNKYFGVTAPSVHQIVLRLERRGLIERTPGQARSIRALVHRDELPRLKRDELPRLKRDELPRLRRDELPRLRRDELPRLE